MRSYTGTLSSFTDSRFEGGSCVYLYQDAEIGGKRFSVLRVPEQLNAALMAARPDSPVTVYVFNNFVGGIKTVAGATFILRKGNHRAMLFVALCLIGAAIPTWSYGGLLLLIPAAFFVYLAWGIWGFKRLPNTTKL